MSAYVIERDIPLPARGELAKKLREMKVGDSIAVETKSKARNAVRSVRHKGKEAGMKFSVRKIDPPFGLMHFRIWRVA